jgi:eukaryotic-like serine/threonine-protein kinase
LQSRRPRPDRRRRQRGPMSLLARWSARLQRGRGAALRADALPAGLRLGGTVLTGPIGRGSSAAVYAATDARSGASCAVKVWCRRSGDDGAAARLAFLAEAQRSQGLDHPGIVRVHRSGSERGLAWIVCELFTAGSLARHAVRGALLPVPTVLDIAMQLAEGLSHAHRHGVVHRDVKPSNALYEPATRRAALADFGIARAPDAEASRSGVLIGSPVYMAPEQLAGQPASASSDLYALAVLTFELLAGRPPFEAGSMGALLRAVAQAAPPPLATLRADWAAAVAARLDAWFEALLAKDPAQRPADGAAWVARARAAATDIEDLLNAANTTNRH